MDEVYSEYGFYKEQNGSLTFEGAQGAAQIAKLVSSYASHPPVEIDGVKVSALRNFATEDFIDVEGDPIPKENMLILELMDGRRVAVRPSGTEPKIKFYLFAKQDTTEGKPFGVQELASLKVQVRDSLENLWAWIQQDAAHRSK